MRATTPRLRIVVGLSGGVDSSVAAWLLKREGHEVVGVFMKNWEDDDSDEYCTSRQDLVDAASVADVIGIELAAVNFASEYRDRVFASFLREYRAGRTPNPDVLCNSEIKFDAFLDHAQRMGADAIATGHYARLDHANGLHLLRAVDRDKDQTYFLHQLTKAQLANAHFPVGGMRKPDVRALARAQRIPTHAKKDSTGICFIGERPFRDFLARYVPHDAGPIETPEGRAVGHHTGLAYYTLGQRQGLGIGGRSGGDGAPWFVAGKDLARNTLIVVQGRDHPMLWSDVVDTGAMRWIDGTEPVERAALSAMTRYRMRPSACTIERREGGWRVRFEQPQWAPTPGQYLVLYDGDACLGGGVIEHAASSTPSTPRSPADLALP
jgi:tRNA-specific 2-thiouridylase